MAITPSPSARSSSASLSGGGGGTQRAQASLEESGDALPAAGLWRVLIRYVCPIAVALVLATIIWNTISA